MQFNRLFQRLEREPNKGDGWWGPQIHFTGLMFFICPPIARSGVGAASIPTAFFFGVSQPAKPGNMPSLNPVEDISIIQALYYPGIVSNEVGINEWYGQSYIDTENGDK